MTATTTLPAAGGDVPGLGGVDVGVGGAAGLAGVVQAPERAEAGSFGRAGRHECGSRARRTARGSRRGRRRRRRRPARRRQVDLVQARDQRQGGAEPRAASERRGGGVGAEADEDAESLLELDGSTSRPPATSGTDASSRRSDGRDGRSSVRNMIDCLLAQRRRCSGTGILRWHRCSDPARKLLDRQRLGSRPSPGPRVPP